MFVYLNHEKYQICGHGEKQMRRRGIKRVDIQSCLNDHQVSFTPSEGYSLYIADHASGKRLQVIVNTESKEIVSAVWLH